MNTHVSLRNAISSIRPRLLSASIKIFLIFEAPVHHGVENWVEIKTLLCKRVFHMGWYLVKLYPANNTAFFQFLQRILERPLNHVVRELTAPCEYYSLQSRVKYNRQIQVLQNKKRVLYEQLQSVLSTQTAQM